VLRAETIYVTEDTYVDGRAGSTTTNYGTKPGLKVFANEGTSDPTHVLIALPDALAAIPAGNLTSVKLWLYNSGTMTLTRPVELHPLTRSFSETGASWVSYDGVNGWSTPGGDYSAGHADVSAPDHGRSARSSGGRGNTAAGSQPPRTRYRYRPRSGAITSRQLGARGAR
jgi:hypothetical protein